MFSATEYPNLAYLAKLIHESLQLPVFYHVNENQSEILYWSTLKPEHPLFVDSIELFRTIAKQSSGLSGPIIHVTNYMEQFAVVPVRRNGQCDAILVIGPTIRKKRMTRTLPNF